MEKTTKSKAQKLFNSGELIMLCASRCTPQSLHGNMWASSKGGSFEDHLADFKRYYCNKSLGKNIHFYKVEV